MKLTTKGRFAVTAMVDLTIHSAKGEPITLAAVSERQKISLSYLEQLFSKLRRSGLVDSVRGPGGGYVLARSAQTISVAQVIQAVNEPIDATQCEGKENCREQKRCLTHDLWVGLNNHILAYLAGISLSQVALSGPKLAAVNFSPLGESVSTEFGQSEECSLVSIV